MNTMTKIGLGLCLAVGVAACGGPSDNEKAGYAFASGLAQGAAASMKAQNSGGLSQRQTGEIDLSAPCGAGGNFTFKGSITNNTFDFTYAFVDCKYPGDVGIGGTWHFTGDLTSISVTGDFSITSPQYSVSCDIDLKVDASSVITGTACGYDVSDLQG